MPTSVARKYRPPMAKGGKQGGRGNANRFGGNSHREDKDYLAYKAAKAKKEKKKDREASAKGLSSPTL